MPPNAFGEIRYWSPETPLEYTAVALLSVALLFLGATLWALGSFWATHDHLPGRAAKLSWLAVRVAGVAAVVVSVSNFLEDYLRLRWFGMTFVIGALALLLGLLCAVTDAVPSHVRRAHDVIRRIGRVIQLRGKHRQGLR